jgi:hypothetical protein
MFVYEFVHSCYMYTYMRIHMYILRDLDRVSLLTSTGCERGLSIYLYVYIHPYTCTTSIYMHLHKLHTYKYTILDLVPSPQQGVTTVDSSRLERTSLLRIYSLGIIINGAYNFTIISHYEAFTGIKQLKGLNRLS